MSGSRAGIPKASRSIGDVTQPRVCACGKEIAEKDMHLLAYNPNARLTEQSIFRIALTHNGDPHSKDVFLDACAELYDLMTGKANPVEGAGGSR